MRLASFTVAGRPGFGIVVGSGPAGGRESDAGVVDLARRLGTRAPTLRAALTMLPELREWAGEPADFAFRDLVLDVPVPDAGKVVCIGRNYKGHVAEGNMELPKQPSVFLRTAESLVAGGAALVRPRVSGQFDFEGELALVIGTAGRHIPREAALSHVAGYTCLNDGSIRDYQFGHSLTVGKNFFRTGSVGPWMVTADAIPDPTRLLLRTRLNGTEVQHSMTDDLIFDIPAIVAYVSSVLPLNPGDVIATGTPEGTGFARRPPLWMKAGDEVEVEVSGIGVLRNGVVDED